MKKLTLVTLVLVVVFGASAVIAQTELYDKYLTAADIEKAGGLTGIKKIPYNPSKGAGGTLNFGLADDKPVVIATMMTVKAGDYEKYKDQSKKYIRGPVAGIGEDAYDGPPGAVQYFIGFKKGMWYVQISSFFNMDAGGKTYLSMDQLTALCKTIADRM
jgi:hypothetical protein